MAARTDGKPCPPVLTGVNMETGNGALKVGWSPSANCSRFQLMPPFCPPQGTATEFNYTTLYSNILTHNGYDCEGTVVRGLNSYGNL